MTKLFKIMLFISSYSPLYLLILINILPYENLGNIKVIFFSLSTLEKTVYTVLIALSITSFFPIMYIRKCQLNDTIQGKRVNKKHEETLSYLVTYIVPLLIIDLDEVNTLITNTFLFILIGFLYVKSNMIHINVLFLLFGWNIYKDSEGRIIISKEKVDYFLKMEKLNSNLRVRSFGGNIFLHRKN